MANPELTGQPSALDRQARALVRATTSPSAQRLSASRQLARGLGWLGIGLGVLGLLATRRLARAYGLQGRESWLQACALREIGTGVALLAARGPQTTSALMWTRVAGDAMDLAALSAAAASPRPADAHPAVAMAGVAAIAAVDLVCAQALQREAQAARQTTDYSDRSGIATSPEQMRGAALESFEQPADMRVSPRPDNATLH